MLADFFLISFRILLLPFSLIYWAGISLRNFFYNKKIFKTTTFGLPLICVGNLSVGGTGKSPMVEYLVRLLKTNYKIATLSRGYKRKTKGYALATISSTALDIGDEPMQFHLKFPDIAVAVGEKRIEAIPQLLHDHPETQCIILDDAFQHRSISAGLNILLTDYNNLFTRDFYLPTGDLRDQKKSYKRSDVIIVTKCKSDLADEEKNKIIREINPLESQHIFFTTTDYGLPYHILTNENAALSDEYEVLLVTGIANPRPIKKKMEALFKAYYLIQYNDHHIFSIDDLNEIKKRFEKINAAKRIILTTEKDAVRLFKFKNELEGLPLYIIPINHSFLFNEATLFDQLVVDFIKNFKKA
ncbi:MAG: tetraacyldisaccharide 4'-kinase [Bacteroidetes bacterium]|nr:tetraacyldisaccharide 4'-kinase [Bacteroidota bacterium]